MSKPNILFILVDQLSAKALESDYINTPALDKLAREGTSFTNSFCTYPLCTPSRASIFSGLMPHQLGINENGQKIHDSLIETTMGNWFKRHGYHCAYGGKWHVPNINITPEFGFNKISDIDDFNLVESCIDFLKRDHSQPLLLVAAFDDPHSIVEYHRNSAMPWGGIEMVPLEHCPNLPESFDIPPDEATCVDKLRNEDRNLVGPFLPEDWQKELHAYKRIIERLDKKIGILLDSVKEQWEEEETLIVFSSDHGEMNGSHQLSGKIALYDESVRVPLIIKCKGLIEEGVKNTSLSSNGIDIFPTLCNFAGIPLPKIETGDSRIVPSGVYNGGAKNKRPVTDTEMLGCNLFSDEQTSNRKYIFVESQYENGRAFCGRSVISENYKFNLYNHGRIREELYHRIDDNSEMVNLAGEERFKDTIEDHRQALSNWLKQTDDYFESHYAHSLAGNVPSLPGKHWNGGPRINSKTEL